jgi:electron transport complex protein RnfB
MMILSTFTTYFVPVIILALIGLIFGVLIAILSKVFAVKEDTRVLQVTEMLPGYNCGACGHAGCSAMAAAIVNEGASVNLCKPIKQDQAQLIRDFLKQQEEAANQA